MLKNLKNAEWSKKLLVFIEIIILCTFVIVCISVFKGLIDGLVAWITGLYSLATIAFGFYYWKAKNENIRKYAKGVSAEDAVKLGKMYDAIFKCDNEGGHYEGDSKGY